MRICLPGTIAHDFLSAFAKVAFQSWAVNWLPVLIVLLAMASVRPGKPVALANKYGKSIAAILFGVQFLALTISTRCVVMVSRALTLNSPLRRGWCDMHALSVSKSVSNDGAPSTGDRPFLLILS
jgi:hypothetical protein